MQQWTAADHGIDLYFSLRTPNCHIYRLHCKSHYKTKSEENVLISFCSCRSSHSAHTYCRRPEKSRQLIMKPRSIQDKIWRKMKWKKDERTWRTTYWVKHGTDGYATVQRIVRIKGNIDATAYMDILHKNEVLKFLQHFGEGTFLC